jgi:2-isopropylmalate synthase
MDQERKITVVDQTLREGMQFRGLVFSLAERKKIVDFQEKLGVDISQAGYPPAHISEVESIKELSNYTKKNNYKIRIAGLCRSVKSDVDFMIQANIRDFHLHSIITPQSLSKRDPGKIFHSLSETIDFIRSEKGSSTIGISLLDVGKTDPTLLKECSVFLSKELSVNIISLPDTSGILSPDIFAQKVKSIYNEIERDTKLGIHCHNDMGFASANTVMGILNGGDVIEVSALGIGERNGIGDLFVVGKTLKDKGFGINLLTDKLDIFNKYYEYVNEICLRKTGYQLLQYNTPFFGDGMKTHVAGTHGDQNFGHLKEEAFYINLLCGKSLVKKMLTKNNIEFADKDLKRIVQKIKDSSALNERSLSIDEIINIVNGI